MHRTKNLFSSIVLSKASAFRSLFYAFFGLAFLPGCTTLPSTGPSSESFGKARWEYVGNKGEGDNENIPFVMVNVDRNIVESLAGVEDAGYFKGTFTDRSPPASTFLGVGDTVRITIFEAGPGGLFVPAAGTASGGNYITLPDQEVDQAGLLSIPYAGKDGNNGFVKAHGRHPAEVQEEIQQRLMNKAIEPQVIVTMVKRTSNLYSVMGDVNAPGRFSLDQGGIRILDALSSAGGPKNNDYNTLITLQRGTTSATARLSTLLTQSENNVFVQPSDLIAVKKDERYYNVLGATHTNSRVAFEAETVTVADAMAKAGGLDGESAEPATVVVFRREELPNLKKMGITLDGHTGEEPIATVYRFNLTEPSGMFLAQRMQLHNNDVVYVSTNPFNDAAKLLGALRDILLIKFIGN